MEGLSISGLGLRGGVSCDFSTRTPYFFVYLLYLFLVLAFLTPGFVN